MAYNKSFYSAPTPVTLRKVTLGSLLTAEFRRFGDLPPELRNKIWVYAALHPRTVKVFERNHKWESPDWNYLTEEEIQAPGVLFACWESRKVTMKLFKAVSETIPLCTPLVVGIGGPVNTSLININAKNTYTTHSQKPQFIKFDIDRFLFVSREAVTARNWPSLDQSNFSDDVLLRIQHLEIILRHDNTNFGSGIEFLLCMLSKEKELKDFTLWIESPEYLSGSVRRVFRMALRKCLKKWYKVGHIKRKIPAVVKPLVVTDGQVWEDVLIVCGSICVMLCLGYKFLRK